VLSRLKPVDPAGGPHRGASGAYRGLVEAGSGAEIAVRLGVRVSNQKNRRDRLSEQQVSALPEIGIDWA
jgi:hypothetical protein